MRYSFSTRLSTFGCIDRNLSRPKSVLRNEMKEESEIPIAKPADCLTRSIRLNRRPVGRAGHPGYLLQVTLAEVGQTAKTAGGDEEAGFALFSSKFTSSFPHLEKTPREKMSISKLDPTGLYATVNRHNSSEDALDPTGLY